MKNMPPYIKQCVTRMNLNLIPAWLVCSQYVNNPTLADVMFIVEGRKFHAHRIALLASSDAFRAMFNGGYREKVGFVH